MIDRQVDRRRHHLTDNGPGLPEPTVKAILDYSVARLEPREAYVSPTRGAQGNALKTIVAMPFVLAGAERRGASRSRPRASGTASSSPSTRSGRRRRSAHGRALSERQERHRVRVHWPVSARLRARPTPRSRFLQIADDYHLAQPAPDAERRLARRAHDGRRRPTPAWAKWLPSDPTRPHWYTPGTFERLIAAYRRPRCRPRPRPDGARVRRRVPRPARALPSRRRCWRRRGWRARRCPGWWPTTDCRHAAGERACSRRCRRHSRPVKPSSSASSARPLAARFEALGCEMESFDYTQGRGSDDDGLPFVVETAFAWRCERARSAGAADHRRQLVAGHRQSVPRPGQASARASIASWRSSGRRRDEPVIFVLHMACPRVEYTDRGKSSVVVRS